MEAFVGRANEKKASREVRHDEDKNTCTRMMLVRAVTT
jgi:hypothetical protein